VAQHREVATHLLSARLSPASSRFDIGVFIALTNLLDADVVLSIVKNDFPVNVFDDSLVLAVNERKGDPNSVFIDAQAIPVWRVMLQVLDI
jgi:hypothetical protein